MTYISQQINDCFFDGLYKQIWKGLVPAELTEAETGFIEDAACLKKNSRVLDMMCGFGRHSIALAKKGYSITAVDNSKDYVEELAEKARLENLPVKAIKFNALEFTCKGAFDAVILMGNSFTYFEKKSCLQFLKNLNDSLDAGGKLIINEWLLGETVSKTFKDKNWFEVNGYTCLTSSNYLFHPTRIETNYTILKAGAVVEKKLAIDYIFSIAEMEELLDMSGFKIVEMYSTPRKRKFCYGDQQIYMVAVKN